MKDNNKVARTFRLDKHTVEIIEEYSKNNKIKKTKVIENALIEYFSKRNIKIIV